MLKLLHGYVNLITSYLPHQHKTDEQKKNEKAFNLNLNIPTPHSLTAAGMIED